MNTLEFAQGIPAEKLANIFRDFFEQHMAAYEILKGMEFVRLTSVDMDNASIMYSIQGLNEKDRDALRHKLDTSNGELIIYGRAYKPDIFMNGDLLCITINK